MKPKVIPEKSFTNADLNELARATLSKGASFRMKALGFSMHPFVKNEDVLTIAPLKSISSFAGRVVAFEIPNRNKLIVHRIVKVTKESYVVKGDNLNFIDGIISEECILGVITKIEREEKIIKLGLGAERLIIAFLSRKGLLPVTYHLWGFVPKYIRKFIKCRIHL